MSTSIFPKYISDNYEIHEWRHACAILKEAYPTELKDIIAVLSQFRLCKSYIDSGGGRKSKVSKNIDDFLYKRGWVEKKFATSIVVDQVQRDSPTHKVDCFKNSIALEIEWNNKDPFYDRDLNNFRLLFELRVISVGVIITRCDDLQKIFDSLGRGASYGQSTTHMSKLLPKIEGGGSAGCPILVFGISDKLYNPNC